ncbi:hypothetical protein MBLNU230_g8026t1 [Neophaeotheca triangularis]
MDTKPVVIGSKSSFANKQAKGKSRQTSLELVDVYVGVEFVGTRSQRLLTRFSTEAKKQLPQFDKNKKAADSANATTATSNTTEAKTQADSKSDESIESQVFESKITAKATGAIVPLITDEPSSTEVGSIPVTPSVTISFPTKYVQPSKEALSQCLLWMDMNKMIHGEGQRLYDFHAPKNPNFPFAKLVDLYAATIAIGLRPAAKALRQVIMDRLTTTAPKVQEIRCIYERLPMVPNGGDKREPLFTRLVTSFNRYAEQDMYDSDQFEAVKTYVTGPDRNDLRLLFNSISESRKRAAQKARRKEEAEQAESRMEEDLAAFGGMTVKELKGNPKPSEVMDGRGIEELKGNPESSEVADGRGVKDAAVKADTVGEEIMIVVSAGKGPVEAGPSKTQETVVSTGRAVGGGNEKRRRYRRNQKAKAEKAAQEAKEG